MRRGLVVQLRLLGSPGGAGLTPGSRSSRPVWSAPAPTGLMGRRDCAIPGHDSSSSALVTTVRSRRYSASSKRGPNVIASVGHASAQYPQ